MDESLVDEIEVLERCVEDEDASVGEEDVGEVGLVGRVGGLETGGDSESEAAEAAIADSLAQLLSHERGTKSYRIAALLHALGLLLD